MFARQFLQRGGQVVLLDFLNGLTVSSASSAWRRWQHSRSSFTLIGFCAENSSDSRINFSSMLKFDLIEM